MELNISLQFILFILLIINLTIFAFGAYQNEKKDKNKDHLESLFKKNAYFSFFCVFFLSLTIYSLNKYPNLNEQCLEKELIKEVLVKNYNNMNMVLTDKNIKRRSYHTEINKEVCVKTSQEVVYINKSLIPYYKKKIIIH